jgi:hypothetical protein
MKVLISILLIVAFILGAWKFFDFYERHSNEKAQQEEEQARRRVNPDTLPGLDYRLATAYAEAQKKGLIGLRDFLKQYKGGPFLKDPKLAWIEIDYLLLVSVSDPAEARRIYADVHDRTKPESPVYDRVKSLEPNFK